MRENVEIGVINNVRLIPDFRTNILHDFFHYLLVEFNVFVVLIPFNELVANVSKKIMKADSPVVFTC